MYWISWFNVHPGARFSKVPKLYGPFLGVAIPFVSQERRGFKSSNFTFLFSAKSEGRRTIRFRMGHDTSSKQHNIS